MKKIIVINADGMIGHVVSNYLSEQKEFNLYNLCYQKKMKETDYLFSMDDLDSLIETIHEINPSIIINCLDDENNKDNHYVAFVNTFFPRWLAEQCHKIGCKLIHISNETILGNMVKAKSPITKLSKELGLIDTKQDLVFKATVIGPELKATDNLFDWFFNHKETSGALTEVPYITSLELAKTIKEAIDENLNGTFTITSTPISTSKLLNSIKEIFHKDEILIHETNTNQMEESELLSNYIYRKSSQEEMLIELKEWMIQRQTKYQRYFPEIRKEKVIIAWSRINGDPIKDEAEREAWIQYRMKIFMNYTAQSFVRQTNQNFYYFINYDEKAAPFVLKELEKYPKLPNNIIFTDNYMEKIKDIIVDYNYLYFVRIDSDDMYQRNYIQKLTDFHPKKETQVLISQSGYIFDVNTGQLGTWFYESPPFFTLIYKTEDFLRGFRYLLLQGHKSVITFPHELMDGNNFLVTVHNKNTVTIFNSSFCKGEIKDESEKQAIINDFSLRLIDECN